MKIHSLLILILITLSLTGAAAAQDKNTVALQTLVKQMVAAQTDFDVAALEKLTTLDYIEISPLGEFDPREKMLGFYKPELKPKNMSMKSDVDEYSIRSYGKSAVVIARLNYLMTMDGKTAPPRSIRATYVCRKEKGVWKVASAQFTGIRPAAPPAKTN